jgi:hypothetical protein
VNWPNLGYADAYSESFRLFSVLQEDGTIPPGVRFQMQYPTPLASLAGTIAPEEMPGVAAAYEAALFAEQPQGTTAEQVRLIDALLTQSPSGTREWGVCTECGIGRVAREDVPTLLDLHREILAAQHEPV